MSEPKITMPEVRPLDARVPEGQPRIDILEWRDANRALVLLEGSRDMSYTERINFVTKECEKIAKEKNLKDRVDFYWIDSIICCSEDIGAMRLTPPGS
jgi:hypothetical protein